MKLQDLKEYSGHATTEDGYLHYLKHKGFRVPRKKGKKGFLFISFEPEKVEKRFSTLSDAKSLAPTEHGKLWVIMDTTTGKVADMPEWWLNDHYHSWTHRKQH